MLAPVRASDRDYFATRFAALAHRGGFSPASPPGLENSLRAFVAASDLGFRYLETDVHATADGHLVAFHDDHLDRVTDAGGLVAELPLSVVREARIGGSEPVPLLDELLDALPRARFNIDIPAPGAVRPLVEALSRHAAQGRVCVGSFDDSSIRAFRRLTGGAVATSASPPEVVRHLVPGVRRLLTPGVEAFQVPVRHERTGMPIVTRGLARAAHAAGAVFHYWTNTDAPEAQRLVDLGVDGLVSDDLHMLKGLLVRRGLWEGNA